MPYAIRNVHGEIIGLTASPNSENDEPVDFTDPDVLQFMAKDAGDISSQPQYHELLIQDLQQIRILEDLIDLLTAKGIILFSELPSPAQEKLLRKKTRREELSQSNDILVDDDPIL
ncbi:MAG: hypothetical protein LBM56_01835 [Burkholderiaceae bacterium]|jgi:hypothetical protein|nr:hypothetical protein [Burkholderiaceae bacterium]